MLAHITIISNCICILDCYIYIYIQRLILLLSLFCIFLKCVPLYSTICMADTMIILNYLPADNHSCFLSFYFSHNLSTYSLQVQKLLLHLMALNDTRTHTHTHSIELLWTRDRSVAETSYLTTNNIRKSQTAVPLAGFEPTIPARERPHTHALDLAATGIDDDGSNDRNMQKCNVNKQDVNLLVQADSVKIFVQMHIGARYENDRS